jgi:hypothetical protein
MTFDYNEWLARAENGKASRVLGLPEDAQRWLAVRQEEAVRINPDTAEVWMDYGRCSDPYNLYPEMPDWALFACDRGACDGQLNELYFVRRPLGKVWVWVGSLSEEVRNALLSGLDLERLEWIQDATMPMRPVRFYRRCSMMRGRNIIKMRSRPGWWCNSAEQAASERALDSAVVSERLAVVIANHR